VITKGKAFGIGLVALVAGYFIVLPGVGRIFESRTREVLLELVARELPATADAPTMQSFLIRHGAEVGIDDYHSEIIGVMPRTTLDGWLMNRQVQIVLNTDANGRFSRAEVRFHYTFL